ncbi:hypothetical protein BC828DRAFT_410159 [Blastocladiella britannica]|nr:hypothetical protein BC828DRAFT_410159 [Blastocladiella britannica]
MGGACTPDTQIPKHKGKSLRQFTDGNIPGKVQALRNLLEFLDDPATCDCSFLSTGAAVPIRASKMLLIRASLFFCTLFTSTAGDFAETAAVKAQRKGGDHGQDW